MKIEEFRDLVRCIEPGFVFKIEPLNSSIQVSVDMSNPFWPIVKLDRPVPFIAKVLALSTVLHRNAPDFVAADKLNREMEYISSLLAISHEPRSIHIDDAAVRWFNSLFNCEGEWFEHCKQSFQVTLPSLILSADNCARLNLNTISDLEENHPTVGWAKQDELRYLYPKGYDQRIQLSSVIVFMGSGFPNLSLSGLFCSNASDVVWELLNRISLAQLISYKSINTRNAFCCLFEPSAISDAWFQQQYPTLPLPRLIWEPILNHQVYSACLFSDFIITDCFASAE